MARRARFQDAGVPDYAGDVLKGIAELQGSGEAQAGSIGSATTTSVRKPKKMQEGPYTEAQIAASPVLGALKRGITSEEAVRNLRALNKVMNMMPVAGTNTNQNNLRQYQRAFAMLTPEQRNAEKILDAMGIKREDAQGNLFGRDRDESMLRNLGIDPSAVPNYGTIGVNYTTTNYKTSVANPLTAQQRTRIQRLKGMSAGTMSDKQKAALARLRAKKNAVNILP
jgi:hypothetical protein